MFGHMKTGHHGKGFGRGRGKGRRSGKGFGTGRRFGQQSRPMWTAPAPGMEVRNMETRADVCPLCDNHCPLNSPGCGKGQAFLHSMNKGRDRI